MQRLTNILLLALLLLVRVPAARATDITLSTFTTPSIYRYDAGPATIRFFPSETFTTSDGKVVIGNVSKSATGFYFSTTCTVASNVLTCAAIVLPATTNSSKPLASYSAVIYDANRNPRDALFSAWKVPHTSATACGGACSSLTLKQLEAYNAAPQRPLGDSFMTREQTLQFFANQTFANPATVTTRGVLKSTKDVADPVAVEQTDYAGLGHNGVGQPSVAPATPGSPVWVGDNDNTRVPPTSGARYVIANGYTGADMAAQVNVADAALGSDRGVIYWYGDGTVGSAGIVLSANHTLQLGAGVITVTTSQYPFRVKDGASIVGSGRGTVIKESTAPTNPYGLTATNQTTGAATGAMLGVIRDYNSSVDNHAAGALGVIIRDLQIQGASASVDSAQSTVAVGNGQGWLIDNVYLKDTNCIGISIGGGGASGNYARSVTVRNSTFKGLAFVAIASVNADHVDLLYNHILAMGQDGYASNAPGIDAETNGGTDRNMHVQIIGNTINAVGSVLATTGNAIIVHGITTSTHHIKIIGNTIIGGALGTMDRKIPFGIQLDATQFLSDVDVYDNSIQRVSQGLQLSGTRINVARNYLYDVGGGGQKAIEVPLPLTRARVEDNTCAASGEVSGDCGINETVVFGPNVTFTNNHNFDYSTVKTKSAIVGAYDPTTRARWQFVKQGIGTTTPAYGWEWLGGSPGVTCLGNASAPSAITSNVNTTASITGTFTTLTTADTVFDAGMVGMSVTVASINIAGGSATRTIATYVSPQQVTLSSSITTVAPDPAAAVTMTGTVGSTTYTYRIVAVDYGGNRSAVSSSTATTTGPAALSAHVYNTVTWAEQAGAVSYDVLLNGTTTKVGNSLTTSFNDVGTVAAYTAPTRNETCDLTVGGRINVAGQVVSTVAPGIAPLVVTSTTNVPNLNASSLNGATFAAPGAIGGGTSAAGTFTVLKTAPPVTLATTTPLDLGTSLAGGNTLNYTPTQSATLNIATVPSSQEFVLIVTTSGTSSYTITFGTNFKTTGTLATGTVSAQVFVLKFVCNGTICGEVSRTVAM